VTFSCGGVVLSVIGGTCKDTLFRVPASVTQLVEDLGTFVQDARELYKCFVKLFEEFRATINKRPLMQTVYQKKQHILQY
jgi:hypothetical protein